MPGTYIYPLKRVFLNLSGGTVTGSTLFTQNLSAGTIFSGSTDIGDIFAQIGETISTGATRVQNGLNTYTGGTTIFPTVNISALTIDNLSVSADSIFNTLSANSISGLIISSGSTNLYSIFSQIGASDQSIGPGSNIITGGTAINPIISVVPSPSFYGLSVSGISQFVGVNATSIFSNTISGGTIFSGSNDLYSIFAPLGLEVTAIQPGSNITTGGTATQPTINLTASPSINGLSFSGTATGSALSATTVSASTIFSGSTDLNTYFNQDRAQINTKANISGTTFTGGISAPGITDSLLNYSQVVYAGTGGLLKANSGLTFDDSIGNLYINNIQVGSPSFSGTVTIWGNVNVMGQAISAFTHQLLIEDNNISLNYNPTGGTAGTSLGAGLTIQDGSGVIGTDVFWDIRGSASTIYNRALTTNLYDIRIRESGTTMNPNGAYVLASDDILQGGSF